MPHPFPLRTHQDQLPTSPTTNSHAAPCGRNRGHSAFPTQAGIAGPPATNTLAQLHRLSIIARAKLYREASYPDHSLLLLVGHANLLDDIFGRIEELEAEADAALERSVSLGSSWNRGAGEEEEEEEGGEEVEGGEGEDHEEEDRAYYALSRESDGDDDDETDEDDDEDDETWENFEGDEDAEVDNCLCFHGDTDKKEVRVIVSVAEDSDEEMMEEVDVGSVEEHLPSAGFKDTYMVQFLGPPSWR
ncbi:hypothetical protein B0T18DRAFT_237589 [Schizothecium vesticola]|uniref:Uncharacterized protein n=1 Tax=Schizothecium vesticola TaxID=314040 RepID=A0AA40BPM4_9PEZI|nr:hypothetical protein B0T18DRAFT_237589 [Schizothecium vesticola]